MEIKIIRDSIKPNPKAGQTTQKVLGRRETECNIIGNFPDFLKDGENCYILEESFVCPKKYRVSLLNESLVPELMKFKGAEVEITTKNDFHTVYFPPLPQYLYEYENPPLKCLECKNMVFLNNIKEDCNDDGCYTVCPICNNIETFDSVRYESIKNVI
jgi:hypothetical protein